MIFRPIVTYNRQGVAKHGVIKSNHCIAFTSKSEPLPDPQEAPRRGESGMLPGIRIRPKRRKEKLDAKARIDFSRMYTVEHSVKVYDFGDVYEEYLDWLSNQWIMVFSQSMKPSSVAQQPALGNSNENDYGKDEEAEGVGYEQEHDDDNDDEDEDDKGDEEEDDDEEDDDDDEDEEDEGQGVNAESYASGLPPDYSSRAYGYQLGPQGTNPQYNAGAAYPPSSYTTSPQYNQPTYPSDPYTTSPQYNQPTYPSNSYTTTPQYNQPTYPSGSYPTSSQYDQPVLTRKGSSKDEGNAKKGKQTGKRRK
jgi:hypothetical protein